MPVDPGALKKRPLPAFAVGAADPDFTSRLQHSRGILQHLLGRKRVFQHVGQNRNVVQSRGLVLGERARVHRKSAGPRNARRLLAEFQPGNLKSVSSENLHAASFVATDIQQPSGSFAAVERNVSVRSHPYAVPERRQKSLAHPGIKSSLFSAKVVMRLIQLSQFFRFGYRKNLFQSAPDAASHFIISFDSKTCVAKSDHRTLQRSRTIQAASFVLPVSRACLARELDNTSLIHALLRMDCAGASHDYFLQSNTGCQS